MLHCKLLFLDDLNHIFIHQFVLKTDSLGIVLYRLGRVAEALQSFKRAVELDPGNADAVRNLEALEKSRQQVSRH